MHSSTNSHQGQLKRRADLDRSRLVVLAVILAGASLRLFRLGEQSFWLDEALSIYYAKPGVTALLAGLVGGNHPPLYFLLLHFWYPLAGQSELALRYVSVFFGVLTLPHVYQIA